MQALNIVLLPDEDAKKWVVATSTKLNATNNSEFVVDGTTHLPHISLYQSEYDEANVAAVKTVLAQIAQKTRPFAVSLLRTSTMGPFLFCEAGKNRPIQILHEALVSVLNPLRDPLCHTRLGDVANMPPYFKDSAKKYGYVLAKQHYYPHITLTAFQTAAEAETVMSTITVPPISFLTKSLYLTNIDKFGTCTQILEEFPFSG
jgi:2'-5' RNA ligase